MNTCAAEPCADRAPLEVECRRSGRRWQVSVSNGLPVHSDILDLRLAVARRRFAAAVVAKLPGVDADQIEDVLLREAARVDPKPQAAPSALECEELSGAMVLRPELFFAPQVCGLSIPRTVTIGGEPKAKWATYLQWADGTRQALNLDGCLETTNGRIFFTPIPTDPLPGASPGWSAGARERWLAGEKTDPVEVFTGLCATIAHFLDLPNPESTAAILALWIVLTYAYPAWDAVPYLYLGGPKGSGKSRLFEVLARLVFRALCSSNMSAPCLFRSLHEKGGTLIFDEAERLRESTPDVLELRSILLAGYKRGARASRLEASGDSFRLIEFSVYGPKAVACIAGLPGPLMDRCVGIIMFRSAAESEKPKRRIDENPSLWQGLRDSLHALTLEHGAEIAALAADASVCPPGISGRSYELWQPLMALAAWFEFHGAKGLLILVQAHARELIALQADETTSDVDETLLKALTGLIRAGELPTIKQVLAIARDDEPELLKRYSSKAVGNTLSRFGIRITKGHGERRYKVEKKTLARIQARYGIDLGFNDAETSEAATSSGEAADSEPVEG